MLNPARERDGIPEARGSSLLEHEQGLLRPESESDNAEALGSRGLEGYYGRSSQPPTG
jgi:hypothetical protein